MKVYKVTVTNSEHLEEDLNELKANGCEIKEIIPDKYDKCNNGIETEFSATIYKIIYIAEDLTNE